MENEVIPRFQLVHGAYYRGDCQDTFIARWNGNLGFFVYWKSSSGQLYPDCVRYWGKGDYGFKPYESITPDIYIPLNRQEFMAMGGLVWGID